MSKLVYVCLLLVICNAQADNFSATHASDLETALSSGYHTFVRPYDETDVYIRFGISHITKLDIVDQQFHVNGFMQMFWYDNRLQWTPADYGNMTKTYMKTSNIWIPPIVLNNAAGTMEIISDNSDLASVPVLLFYSGVVYWLAPTSFVAQCTVNIQFYPFDIQTCHLLITPWLYSSEEIDLNIAEFTNISTELYEENGEWDLIDTNIELTTRVLEGYIMPAVKFSLTLKRKYSYYLLNMVLPVIFLAVLGAFVFLLPVECGEKNGFGLTILLSLSVVMTIVSDSIPPVSSSTCILSVYLLATYIVCAIEVLITVVNIRIHNMKQLDYIPSIIIQGFMNRFLAKIARYERAGDIVKKETKNTTPQTFSSSKVCISISTIANEKMVAAGVQNAACVQNAWEPENDEDNEAEEEMTYTYQDLSIMLDKICFVFFLILTIFQTLLFLLVLMVGGGQSG